MDFKIENITEVVSHNHVILQCMDIILGAMQFPLNDMHKIKDPETNGVKKQKLRKKYINVFMKTFLKYVPGLISEFLPA
jgi:hypothetical protein